MAYSTKDDLESLETRQLVTATKQAQQVAVDIHLELLVSLVTEDRNIPASKCIKGLPIGAEFIRPVYRDFSLSLIFEHESFDMVRVGNPIPIFELEFEEI